MDQSFKFSRLQGMGFLILYSLLSSTAGLLIKMIHWPAMTVAGLRSGISILCFLILLRNLRFTFSRIQLAGTAVCTITMIMFISATKLTSAGNAIFLHYTSPIYVALFSSWFLKEKIHSTEWILIFSGIMGIFFFFCEEMTSDGFWGNICALASAIPSAGYIVLTRLQSKTSSPFESIMMADFITFLICIPSYVHINTVPSDWFIILFLGIIQNGVATILFGMGTKYVRATDAVLICMLEPICNPLWVILMLGERLTKFEIIGGSIILAISLVSGLRSARQTNSAELKLQTEIIA